MYAALVIRVACLAASTSTSSPAGADAPKPSSAATDPATRALEEAGDLFRQGQDKFDTSDFSAAIDLWTRAYESLPDGPEFAATRSLLLANIAQAHVEAYAIDHDPDHLRRADKLFADYLATVDTNDEETRATVQAQRDHIAAIVAKREREEAERAENERQARQAEAARREQRQARLSRRDEPAPADPSYTRWERAMLIGGGVTIAFGIGTTGAMGTFLWLRDEEEKDGAAAARLPTTSGGELQEHRRRARRFNGLAISTGAAAGVLTVIGIGVVAAAHVHRVKRDRRAWLGPGPGMAGLSLTGRF